MKKKSNPLPPKCPACRNGYDGTNGNGYQPCSCRPAPPPPPPKRSFYQGFFGLFKTKESKEATRDWYESKKNSKRLLPEVDTTTPPMPSVKKPRMEVLVPYYSVHSWDQRDWREDGQQIMASKFFAGQELIVLITDEEPEEYDISYLGLHSKPIVGYEKAKSLSEDFAKSVLRYMLEKI